MIRLAHVSDVHLFCPKARWQPGDWHSKRVTGWLNLRLLGRAWRFRHAASVLKALAEDIHQRRPDCVIFSGDATALGFEEELAEVTKLLRVGRPDGLGGLAVPGNHDYYTRRSAGSFLFEQYFEPWLQGERVDNATYPFARRVGPIWLVGVNSSTGNKWIWDATGRVGNEQLDRLGRLLASPQLAGAPRVLVTHYPVARADGTPENRTHCLRDCPQVVEAAQDGAVGLWLHGHRHKPYHLPPSPECPIPSICAGSGTQEGIWTYAEHSYDGGEWHVERRRYQPETQKFEAVDKFATKLA